jgi:hypothetical protein
MPRLAAGLVAAICWAGLMIQFRASYANLEDFTGTAWVMLRFFTVITNLLLAIVMTATALRRRVSPFLLGGITLAILLVGAVYMTLLRGLVELSGGALLADLLLHKVAPVAMALWWLLFAPRARLRWTAPWWWALYPLFYFGYALLRGAFGDKYPYPFMDVGKLGWTQTALNAAGIAMAFLVAGFALVWIDSWRPLGSRRSTG